MHARVPSRRLAACRRLSGRYAAGITNIGRSGAVNMPPTCFAGTRRADSSMRSPDRSEEHTSELQSLMRNSYAVFCLKKNNTTTEIYQLPTPLYPDTHTDKE